MLLFPTTKVSAFGAVYEVPTEFCTPHLNADAVLNYIGLRNDGSRHACGQYNNYVVRPICNGEAFAVHYAKVVGC